MTNDPADPPDQPRPPVENWADTRRELAREMRRFGRAIREHQNAVPEPAEVRDAIARARAEAASWREKPLRDKLRRPSRGNGSPGDGGGGGGWFGGGHGADGGGNGGGGDGDGGG